MAEETVSTQAPLPEPESRPCTSSLPHVGIPGWLDPGTSDYYKQAARVGVQELLQRRRVYLNGFTDSRGNHWCGQCFWRCRLMDLGERLGYPALDGLRLAAGTVAWLRYAREVGVVRIEDAVRFVERLLRSRGVSLP
jgi:hypothetical protein